VYIFSDFSATNIKLHNYPNLWLALFSTLTEIEADWQKILKIFHRPFWEASSEPFLPCSDSKIVFKKLNNYKIRLNNWNYYQRLSSIYILKVSKSWFREFTWLENCSKVYKYWSFKFILKTYMFGSFSFQKVLIGFMNDHL